MESNQPPPQMLMIDLHRLIMSSNYRDMPSDVQRRIIEKLLAQYVKEYKPWH